MDILAHPFFSGGHTGEIVIELGELGVIFLMFVALGVLRSKEGLALLGAAVMDEERDDMPLMPSLRALFAQDEDHNRTLFAAIEDNAVLERAITATQDIVGDFRQPHTGILFVVPVSRAWGVPKANRRTRRSHPRSSPSTAGA